MGEGAHRYRVFFGGSKNVLDLNGGANDDTVKTAGAMNVYFTNTHTKALHGVCRCQCVCVCVFECVCVSLPRVA